MQGSEKIRHCSKCQFNVYNFQEMTEEEIDRVYQSQERVCARMYVRPDGTYMTKKCRTKTKRKRILIATALVVTIPLAIIIIKKDNLSDSKIVNELRSVPLIGPVVESLFPRPVIVVGEACNVPVPAPPSQQGGQNPGGN